MDKITKNPKKNLTIDETVEPNNSGKSFLPILKKFSFGHYIYLAKKFLLRVKDSDNEDEKNDLTAVILIQAAALECFLNDVLIEFTRESFGIGSKLIAEGMLGGSVRSKILRVVPVLSRATKELVTDSSTVQLLFTLIRMRNRITHTADYYLDDFEDYEKQMQKLHSNHGLTLDECEKYQKALNNFISAIWNGPLEEPQWQHELIKDATPEEE